MSPYRTSSRPPPRQEPRFKRLRRWVREALCRHRRWMWLCGHANVFHNNPCLDGYLRCSSCYVAMEGPDASSNRDGAAFGGIGELFKWLFAMRSAGLIDDQIMKIMLHQMKHPVRAPEKEREEYAQTYCVPHGA